jgi:hypothetical protein
VSVCCVACTEGSRQLILCLVRSRDTLKTKLPPEYRDRPRPPKDSYLWHQFLKEQESRPLAWHGTSTVFRESIQRTGLNPNIDRRELEVVARLLKMWPPKSLNSCSRDLAEAICVLGAFTQSTASSKTLCFTFDYVNALHYALRNRGGETLHNLLIALECTVREGSAALQQSDLGWARAQHRKFSKLLASHRPLLLGVRFHPELLEDHKHLDLLNVRSAFDAALKDSYFPALIIGHYSPGRIFRGTEFRASRSIPPEQIAYWKELDEGEQQSAERFFSRNPLI